MWGIYNPTKFLPIGSRQGQNCPSGGPPGRPANDHFYDRCATGRPGLDTESSCSLPVDQGHFQIAELSRRSAARSTYPPAQAGVYVYARRSTGLIDRLLQRSTVPVDRQKASPANKGFKNLSFFYQINPIKYT